PRRGRSQVLPPSKLSKYPSPAATRRVSGASGWTANSWVSYGPPGRRSRQLCPPSVVDTSAPASTATQRRPGSRGWQAIHRTWWVSGRGGKAQLPDEGSAVSALVRAQLSPPSSDRQTSL